MDIVKNSIWMSEGAEGLDDGLYRVLEVMGDLDCIIIFPVIDNDGLKRPISKSLITFQSWIKLKSIYLSEFSLPSYLLVDENNISIQHKQRRDKNYALIEGIIADKVFLFDYSTKKRVSSLSRYAEKKESDRKTIARLLSIYWRFGQDRNALLPAFKNSGASGRDRVAKGASLGAPKRQRTLSVDRVDKFKLSSTDKEHFRKALKKYHLKPNGKDLKETYKELLRSYYSDQISIADACGKAPSVPSFRQFTYWKKKLFSAEEIIKSRTTERDYLLNKRGLLGSVNQESPVAGSCFEIDATVADIHIVSSFGKQYALGRPTIYSVVDRASRMIVGFHVSLYHASWRAARQALVNCFLPKVEYCKEFGIDISDTDWPCAHVPQRLMCDNGEMIGLKPQELVVPMTELQLAAPYRPDFKSIVEQRFRLLNKEVLHDLLGSTRGGNVIRGSRDPRKDSIYTLKEVTKLLISGVLEHNRSIFSDLGFTSPLLIKNNLSPTPLNCWKVSLANHCHALKRADKDEVIARLLPPEKVSMTRSGILFNGMYYSCEQVIDQNLASLARSNGRWRMEARIDENTTNHIYVRLNDGDGFTKCDLLPKSKMLKNVPMIEAELVQDWLNSKKEMAPVTVESIKNKKFGKSIEAKAKFRAKENPLKYSEKTRDTRKHRQEEIFNTVNIAENNEQQEKTRNSGSNSNVVNLLPRRNRKIKE